MLWNYQEIITALLSNILKKFRKYLIYIKIINFLKQMHAKTHGYKSLDE